MEDMSVTLKANEVIADGIIKSACGLCPNGCGVLIHVKNGKVQQIEGDPDCPTNRGVICSLGQASLEHLYHPDRLRHPLKRIGDRGEGKWQQVSWDEALGTIARELTKVRENHGVESIVIIRGGAKGLSDGCSARLANAIGTPNYITAGSICWLARVYAENITYGRLLSPDYMYPPACIINWGYNPAETRIGEYQQITQALNRGSKLAVIDARKTDLAKRADIFVPVRPSSDLALALGMLNVVVNEGLYDKTFVDKWTVGFDKLKAHIQDYTPEKVEKVTWVPAEKIREITRFYATNRPASITWGNAMDEGVNSLQTARAISILRAITGNICVPGSDITWTASTLLSQRSPEFILAELLPNGRNIKGVTAGEKLIPTLPYITPQGVIKAIIDEDPYPIRAAYIQGSNVLLCYTNTQRTYEALKKLDFLAVADIFMTPTAAMADIVLPVATYLEFDNISAALRARVIARVQQKVTNQVGESWSDLKIINQLAKKMGLRKYFWEDEHEILDTILKPAGLTFEEFRRVGTIATTPQYRYYEKNGFNTPSQKVEIYSSQLEEWGFDPLPTYYEPPETPFSEPELAKEYPLIMTCYKVRGFRHSAGRQIVSLRGNYPDPVISIHPETAKKLGIEDENWVYIETKRGRITQKAAFTTDIDPRVVGVDFAWWFPEKGVSDLYGWAESNINILTDDKPPFGRELGSASLKGILCKVYKAEPATKD